MKTAKWNGVIIAQSEKTINLEGNEYFPVDSINKEFFTESSTTSVCPWKGTANYYNVTVNGAENKDAAWYYQNPSSLADGIKGHVAIWRGVEVE
jgi:uncharacterized protein (DUF427 family)